MNHTAHFRMTPARRAYQLEHIRAAVAECERDRTDAEVREAAIALGREDLLPDLQQELDLPRDA